jgi:hypothetical protein
LEQTCRSMEKHSPPPTLILRFPTCRPRAVPSGPACNAAAPSSSASTTADSWFRLRRPREDASTDHGKMMAASSQPRTLLNVALEKPNSKVQTISRQAIVLNYYCVIDVIWDCGSVFFGIEWLPIGEFDYYVYLRLHCCCDDCVDLRTLKGEKRFKLGTENMSVQDSPQSPVGLLVDHLQCLFLPAGKYVAPFSFRKKSISSPSTITKVSISFLNSKTNIVHSFLKISHSL